MDQKKKTGRYARLYKQLDELMLKSSDKQARMASICAVLHHKMDGFFWTGFYMLQGNELIVSCYQGPLACMELERDKGVCWAGINSGKAVIVPDVEKFPGHIACDSRSKSEIVIPLQTPDGKTIGVLDIDSQEYSNFDEIDALELTKILKLIYK